LDQAAWFGHATPVRFLVWDFLARRKDEGREGPLRRALFRPMVPRGRFGRAPLLSAGIYAFDFDV
jgi:hypothetical protein